LTDVVALYDSYAVEVKKDGLVLLRIPLWMCDNRDRAENTPEGLSFNTKVDFSLSLSLVQYAPPFNEEPGVTRKSKTRWPFYTDAPLEVLPQLGDQWQQYTFTPGRRYRDRTMPNKTKGVKVE